MDLAYCNGVFHHIPLKNRLGAVTYLYRALRPGGIFAFWENNPWNPGTHFVMHRIPFDCNARKLSPLESRELVKVAGFEILSTHFLFIFPRILARFRVIEPSLARLPFGAQYQILCRKPQ